MPGPTIANVTPMQTNSSGQLIPNQFFDEPSGEWIIVSTDHPLPGSGGGVSGLPTTGGTMTGAIQFNGGTFQSPGVAMNIFGDGNECVFDLYNASGTANQRRCIVYFAGNNFHISFADDALGALIDAIQITGTSAAVTAIALNGPVTAPSFSGHGAIQTMAADGTIDAVSVHMVRGEAALTTGSVTITLTGNAQFTDATTYQVFVTDDTGTAAAVSVVKTNGSSFTIHGTGTDSVSWMAMGN
jgi:hypothetical protein